MKTIIMMLMGVGMALNFAGATPADLDISAKQRYPWNGLVDLKFTITGESGMKYDASFTAKDMVGNTNVAMKTIRKSDGTTAVAKESLLPGTYSWIWDAAADLPKDFKCDRMTVIGMADISAFPYTVKFNANGGTGTMANQSFTYGTAQNLKANAFTRNGYSFVGWATGANGAKVYSDKQSVKNLTTTANGIVNLYAVWTANKYSVKFNANGGTGTMSNQAFVYGTAQNLKANGFSRDGYSFVGWATSANGAKVYSDKESVKNLTTTANGIVNLYAVWTANKYSVKFNANGGTGTMANQSFTYGTSKALTANAFTRTGYVFQGWATSASGGKVYNDKQKVQDLTTTSGAVVNFYAVWGKDPNMVQLWNGGPFWAIKNVGADKPSDYGYYFWWGDTVGYKRENDDWVASDGSNSDFWFAAYGKDGIKIPTYDMENSTLQSEGWITADGVLTPEHDAAQAHWGGDWRMPTLQELEDLYNNCDLTWTKMNGVNGYIVRGRGSYSSNSIFLPCAGYGRDAFLYDADYSGHYWSPVTYTSRSARSLYFHDHYFGIDNSRYRNEGRSIRPVQSPTK